MLAASADESRHLIVVSDANGILLWVEGNPSVRLRAADSMNFAEGALWSEGGAGTNAIGTALAAEHAVQVFASEHFNEIVQSWTCAAAPVHDPDTGSVYRCKFHVDDSGTHLIVRGFIGPPDRQVRVIGEASDPIAIPYRDHMTLLDVMIATHGMTKYAAGNRAVVVRIDPDGKQQSIKVRLTDLIKYGEIDQNIEMSPGDTLIIPQSWF